MILLLLVVQIKLSFVNPKAESQKTKVKKNDYSSQTTEQTAPAACSHKPAEHHNQNENSQKRYFWGRFYIKVIYAICIFYCIIALLLTYFFIEKANTDREKARQNNKLPPSEKILQEQKDVFANYSKKDQTY